MVFGLGPAGTGKTYLAVAMAVGALLAKKVSRIILVRPAVEAGERLGFLPGIAAGEGRPLHAAAVYDALYDLIDPVKVDKMLEDKRYRDCAAGVYARAHAQRSVHHHG